MLKLKNLRKLLITRNIDAFIIPTQDAHNSEYISPKDKRREFLTGFTGSAGTAVVTQNKASLWVDGRYWIAAEKEVDTKQWEIVKAGKKDAPTIATWLDKNLPPNSTVGFDPMLTTLSQQRKWQKSLQKATLKPVDQNPVDEIWETQPAMPSGVVYHHQEKWTGEPASEKLRRLRKHLAAKNCFAAVITSLDEIAWLFNLRGSDIEFNPVFLSFCVVTQNDAFLFADTKKFEKEALSFLSRLKAVLKPYAEVLSFLKALKPEISREKRILLNPDVCNYAVSSVFDFCCVEEEKDSFVESEKAVKTKVEIEGMRNCHARDGAAKTAWLAWLEEMAANKKTISEIIAADKLEEFRSKEEFYKGLSFDSISASGGNGAIIHYKPTPESHANVDFSKMYLIDSGAQYLDGTTDVTRTVHFGESTPEERKFFTLVLKGHIALARAMFPANLSGSLLDVLARQPLWRIGETYMHGTGHGVGSFLNVHEGPQFIHGGSVLSVGLKNGMFVSNEPGYYKKDHFGIRIESVVLVKPSQYKGFSELETVTMVPIQKSLVDVSLLESGEIAWLDEYHRKVYAALKPRFEGKDERALAFLEKACAEIGRE